MAQRCEHARRGVGWQRQVAELVDDAGARAQGHAKNASTREASGLAARSST